MKDYLPEARLEHWDLEKAGQRVQVIKKDKKEGGVLEFGTEMVTAADGSLAALLGASPGASTAVSIMIELIHKCFKESNTAEWQEQFKKSSHHTVSRLQKTKISQPKRAPGLPRFCS